MKGKNVLRRFFEKIPIVANLALLDPKWPNNRHEIEVLGYFIEFGWFSWPDLAYCDSWQRYVATNGGQGADKSILGPRFGPFRPNFRPKMSKIEVFGSLIEFG